MDLKSINFLSKTDWLLKNITKLMKMDGKYKNDTSKRIPAGADKKYKKKRQKLKHNYKGSKDRKREKYKKKLKNVKKLENKQEEILENKRTQNKLSDSSEKIIKNAKGKTDSRTGTSTVTEVKNGIDKVQNVAAKNVGVKRLTKLSSKNNSIKDSEGINKFKKEKTRNKKSTEKVAKTAEISEGKSKPNRTIVKQKDANNSGKDSKSKNESEKKKRRKERKKVSEKKGRDFKVPIESQNSLKKIKAKKERERNKSGNESNSLSESEKKGTKEKSRNENEEIKKLSETPTESEKSKDKKKAKKHSNISKNTNEQSKIMKGKRKKIKGQHITKESKSLKSKISNEKIKLEEQTTKIKGKDKKKSKNTTQLKLKKKGEKKKHVDAILTSGNEKKNEKMKGQGKLRSTRKPERKLLEHRGKKEDKLLKDVKVAKKSSSSLISLTSSVTSTSSTTDSSISPATADSSTMTRDISIESGKSIIITAPIKENKISNFDNKRTTDAKDDPTGKLKEHKERITMIRKQPEEAVKARTDNGSKKSDVKTGGKDFMSTTKSERERDRIRIDGRKIMRVEAFTQKNGKVYDTTRQPKCIRYDTNMITKTDNYTTQKPNIISSPEIKTVKGTEQSTTTLVVDKRLDSEKKDNSNLNEMDNNCSSSSASETESESFEESEPNKIEMKDAMKGNNSTNNTQDSEPIEDSMKATITASPDEMNTDTQSKKSQDRSYVEGLMEIRTLLEIYGMEEEKREAFDKLLDEDLSMSEKEIAKNLSKAVCDLPISKELLEKVLRKMLFSGLLRKGEEEMLQKNLVPQAVNESVTIALLAQVLQRQKFKK